MSPSGRREPVLISAFPFLSRQQACCIMGMVRADHLDVYRKILLIRRFSSNPPKCEPAKIARSLHLYIGKEELSAGVAAAAGMITA